MVARRKKRCCTLFIVHENLKIEKLRSCLNLIRKNPHYGIFLSKLLAQRLRQQTQKVVSLTNELNELKEMGTIPDTFEG